MHTKLLIFAVLFLYGCSSRKKIQVSQSHCIAYNSNKKRYTLGVEGVECKQCALAVLHHLMSLKGVEHAECICPQQDYEQAYFECFIESEKMGFPEKSIKNLLRQDSFELAYLYGQFKGMVQLEGEVLFFKPHHIDINLKIDAEPSSLVALAKKAEHKGRELLLRGYINYGESKFIVQE